MIAATVQDRIAGNKPVILLPDDLNDLEWIFETLIFPTNSNLLEEGAFAGTGKRMKYFGVLQIAHLARNKRVDVFGV